MPLLSRLGAASSRGFGQFAQQTSAKYIEDYFSTYLYNGTGSAQTIPSGIGLADTAEWSTIKTQQNVSYTNDVKIDSNGNIVIVGSANDGTRTYGFVAKYNPSGSLQWQRKLYLSGYSTFLYDVGIDSSDNIYVGGWASSATTVPLFAKYNSSGTIQWQRSLVQTGQFARIRGIALDSSGNVYTAGLGNDGTRDVIQFAKYNTSGTLQWQRKIYQTGATSGNGNIIAIDSSDNIYLTSSSNDGIRGYAIIAKYNTSGVIQWQKKYYDSTGGGQGITTDSSGNVYAFLLANDGIIGTLRYLLKYDSTGALQWQRKFGGSTNEAYGVHTDSSGNVYCIGRGDDGTGAACQIFKYNSSGTLQWQKGLKESTTWGYQGAVSGDNLFVTGYATSNSVAYGFTSKLMTDGTTQSGAAFVTLFTTVETSATATGTSTVGTATDAAGTATDSAGTFTDEAGTTTSSLATQVAVSGAGGLVWIKNRARTFDNSLYDTVRGAQKELVTNNAFAETTQTQGLTGFSSSGFSVGTYYGVNNNAEPYASWTFREQSKYFDIVTYTGNGASNRAISQNLKSTPGLIIIKCTSSGSTTWAVYHRSLGVGNYMQLEATNGVQAVNIVSAVSSTTFTLGDAYLDNNGNGNSYVAYLFAHNAGGFGADGSQNVISCGSYTGTGASGNFINLGYEPQFLLIKKTDSAVVNGDWNIFDNMRGLGAASVSPPQLVSNSSAAENGLFGSVPWAAITSTGFNPDPNGSGYGETNVSGSTYIYLAIRRGPMKTPTDATKVFSPSASSGVITTGFPVDWNVIGFRIGSSFNSSARTRLTGGGPYLVTSSTAAQTGTTNIGFDSNTGLKYSMDPDWINWNFQRAPGFFDVVCYTGTGSTTTIAHNLGVVPELMITKRRNNTSNWGVYSASLGATKGLSLNTTAAAFSSVLMWNDTAPTSSVFTVRSAGETNASGSTYVAYLFASCPGVSKVGSYTGTGATQTISCGFTGGARYVLIKRTDSTGDWWVWDTARGMVAGTDPRIAYNSTAAETNANWVYTTTGGFQIVTSDATVNANGGTYIYLAIA